MRVFSNVSDKSSQSPAPPQKSRDTNQLCTCIQILIKRSQNECRSLAVDESLVWNQTVMKLKKTVRQHSNLNGRFSSSTHYIHTLYLKCNTRKNKEHLRREKGGIQKERIGLTTFRKGRRQRGNPYTKQTKLQGASGRPNLNDRIIGGLKAVQESNQENKNYPIKTIRFQR